MGSKSASRKLSGPGAVSVFKPAFRGGLSVSFLRPTMHFGHLATLLAFLVLFVAPCQAEAANEVFQWEFSGNALSQSLPSCRSFDITVKPFNPANDTHGIPPFYMQAFAIGGTPSTTLIGTDESNLSWTVNQPVGTTMLLTVIDSQGSSGGASAMLYTVTTGQSTQCIPPASTEPAFTVTANVSAPEVLNTCQPWGLTIAGGTPPYNVSIAATAQPVVTNSTMGPDDTIFTFIDRAPPGVQLVVAVSDLLGRWATGTPIVTTAGSEDVTCTGLVSSSKTAAEIKADEEQAAAAVANAQKKKSAIIAVVVVLVLLLFGGVGIFVYLRRRKMQRKAQELSPRQFESGPENIDGPPFHETGGHILSINSFITPDSDTPPRSPTASSSPSNASLSNRALSNRPRFNGNASSNGGHSTLSAGMSIRNPDRPPLNGFPTMSIRRSAKEMEAGLTTAHSVDSEYYDEPSEGSSRAVIERSRSAAVPSAGLSPAPRYPARSASVGTPVPEIVFQHQDAGLVRELPPPYIDRGTRDSESS